MKMTSLKINGRIVSRLSINGREVALGPQCDALCFTSKYNDSTIQLTRVGSPDSINLQTSTNGKSWTPYNVEDIITVPNAGGKVYFKAVGSNQKLGNSPSDYHIFVTTGEFEASGNVNSLLEEDEQIARTMSLENRDLCYVYLFADTQLTKAPELPSTELGYGCYLMMFQNCTSLTQAPELPATTLVSKCYAGMFERCSQLNYVSVGFDNWVQYATNYWLPENTGTFKCPQALINNIPERTTSTVPESWTMTAV